VVIECGGKDPLVVAADADVDAAVEGALWGGFTNAGQTCVGVERVYAVAAVYDEFVGKLAARARALRPGAGEDASYGPMTVPAQADIVRRQVDDALARGAKDLLGGDDTSRPPYLAPRILTRVPADAPAETEETFGPVLTVARVADLDEAVARANAGRYGLGATVYSRRHGEAIARRMRAGMVSVNSVIAFVAVPALPFGGVGDSGFGRVHGADGLREFARPQAISRERVTSPLPVLTFRRAEHAVDRLVAAVRAAYGRR
ncbi:MAG: aldehyde dehydrogenase family protein, partial [Mycobacteriales bacterium]